MNALHQRPPNLPRSWACEALGLSRTGTYPRAQIDPSGPNAAASRLE